MDATIGIRAFLLLLLTLVLSGCASSRWYDNYLPPTEVNEREFNSPVTAQPESIQLVHGEGFEYWVVDEGRPLDINYSIYFAPGDTSPFPSPARISSIEYIYCMFGDKPGMCGSVVTYESEEVDRRKGVLSKIRETNHELIIAALIAKHRRAQYTDKYAQTVIEEEGAVHRSAISSMQRRVWCDFSKGIPKRCNRSIISVFDAVKGRGIVVYMDERMYRYFQRFKAELKHDHPAMEVITGKNNYLTEKAKAWWQIKATPYVQFNYIPKEKLHTEIELEARAKELDKPRPVIPRTMPRDQFAREWVQAYINYRSNSSTSLERDYWFGYREGLLARDFNHQFNLTKEAHEKWTAAKDSSQPVLAYIYRGYMDGLEGTPRPPHLFDVCRNAGLLQELKCIIKGR